MTQGYASGDSFGVNASASILVVPLGYISGDPIAGSFTISGATLAGIGASLGTFPLILGPPGATVSITVGSAPPALATTVPEPASIITWSLLGVGMISGGWYRRRRQHLVATH